LPAGQFEAKDVDGLRFAPALRGYRMDQVDEAIDRLTDELKRREDQIDQLRSELGRHVVPNPEQTTEHGVNQDAEG
jgi:DivIVA domain-containing protein